MRKVILVPALLCGMAVIAGAQTKITGKLTCAKPSVSETAGEGAQMIMFQKSNCTWATPFTIDGSKVGRTLNASVGDMTGGSGRSHGYSSSVFDNGDSTFVHFEGASQMKKDRSGTIKGTWRYVRAADGSAWADITGHYSLAKAKAKKTK